MKPCIEHRQIKMLLKMVHSMDCILEEHPVDEYNKLPKPAAKKFVDAAFTIGSLQKQLFEHYSKLDEPIKLFNFTTKIHLVQRCALEAEHLRPCLTWCFSGEDYEENPTTDSGVCARQQCSWRFA